MKRFLKYSISIVVVILCLHLVAAFVAGGKFDEHYRKFTIQSSPSLIIGSSRANHGLNPDYIQKGKMVNFAFDAFSSPYSKEYNNAIVNFLGESLKEKGIAIIEINPWTLSVEESLEEPFLERTRVLSENISFGQLPNFEYLIKEYNHSWGNIIVYELLKEGSKFSHPNGWLEVNLPMNDEVIKERKESLLASYRRKSKQSSTSKYRLESLIELIDTLNDYKSVYLVEMPVCDELLKIEDTFFNKDSIFTTLTNKFPSVKIIPLQADGLRFIDGHHIYREDVPVISQRLSSLLQD